MVLKRVFPHTFAAVSIQGLSLKITSRGERLPLEVPPKLHGTLAPFADVSCNLRLGQQLFCCSDVRLLPAQSGRQTMSARIPLLAKADIAS